MKIKIITKQSTKKTKNPNKMLLSRYCSKTSNQKLLKKWQIKMIKRLSDIILSFFILWSLKL